MIEEQDDSSWCNSQKTFIRLNLQVRCTVLLGEDGSPLQCFNHPLKPPPQKPTQFLKKSAFHMRIPNPKIRAFAKLTNPQICWRIQQKNVGDKNPHSIRPQPSPSLPCLLPPFRCEISTARWQQHILGSYPPWFKSRCLG